MDEFLTAAIEQARLGRDAGGIPIGSVLVIEDQIVGRGHNRRVQQGSATLHAEMDCLENAGRLTAADYARAVLYSTLSPCDMCSGAALLYKIPKIIVGENVTFQGPEAYLKKRGVAVTVVNSQECIDLMTQFIGDHPQLWNEDIGEPENERDSVPWEVWHRDTFDRDCPPRVDARGSGLVSGLQELWARYLFETVTADGKRGFSNFHLKYDDRMIGIEDGYSPGSSSVGWSGAQQLREWMFGTKKTSLSGYVNEAKLGLLEKVAETHAAFLASEKSSADILETASRSSNRQEFENLLAK